MLGKWTSFKGCGIFVSFKFINPTSHIRLLFLELCPLKLMIYYYVVRGVGYIYVFVVKKIYHQVFYMCVESYVQVGHILIYLSILLCHSNLYSHFCCTHSSWIYETKCYLSYKKSHVLQTVFLDIFISSSAKLQLFIYAYSKYVRTVEKCLNSILPIISIQHICIILFWAIIQI